MVQQLTVFRGPRESGSASSPAPPHPLPLSLPDSGSTSLPCISGCRLEGCSSEGHGSVAPLLAYLWSLSLLRKAALHFPSKKGFCQLFSHHLVFVSFIGLTTRGAGRVEREGLGPGRCAVVLDLSLTSHATLDELLNPLCIRKTEVIIEFSSEN